MDYTSDQIDKLKSLGIDVENQKQNIISPLHQGEMSEGQKGLDIGNSKLEIKHSKFPVFPLLSISGLTLLSFSGLILLKGKSQATIPSTVSPVRSPQDAGGPTQVPKSIQHYLLTSQQLFSRALQLQSSQNPATAGSDQSSTIDLLNQSILAATEAIKEFPTDYRGYQQRGRIYQSLINSKPDLINQSISDLASAQKLNPSSAEITHTLASLYAQKGDAQNTIIYLNQTVALEPTKAQNFYDLAKIQQQAGLLPQALETYNRLVTLVTDPTQKSQVENEKAALEKLVGQTSPKEEEKLVNPIPSSTSDDLPSTIDSPAIQAIADGGLIIAAPDEGSKIEVTNKTDSNSLSGNTTLPANQKEITITNTNLSSTSQVYITVTKGGKNQNLQVLSKSKESFVVGLDSPISENVEFKWWIIN